MELNLNYTKSLDNFFFLVMILWILKNLTRVKQAKKIKYTVLDLYLKRGYFIIHGFTSEVEPALEQTINYIELVTTTHFKSVH